MPKIALIKFHSVSHEDYDNCYHSNDYEIINVFTGLVDSWTEVSHDELIFLKLHLPSNLRIVELLENNSDDKITIQSLIEKAKKL